LRPLHRVTIYPTSPGFPGFAGGGSRSRSQLAGGAAMWPLEIPALIDWGTAIIAGFLAGTALSSPPQHPVSNEPRPPIARPATDNSREMQIAADSWHQCYAEGWLTGPNGRERKFPFLLDSGDSDKLTVNRRQAAELGFDVPAMSFDQKRETANGFGKAAIIEVAQFRLGGYRVTNVDAEVDYNGIGSPIIGAGLLKVLEFHLGETSCSLTLPNNNVASVRSASVEQPRAVALAAPVEPPTAYCVHMLHLYGQVMPGCKDE
jgi:clan AA aspartic protease (TIGR02281 family)